MTPEQLKAVENAKIRRMVAQTWGDGNGFRSFATSAADSASFGFGDEVAAGLDTLRGKGPYEQNLTYHRANLEKAQEDTLPSIAGSIVGAIGPGGILGKTISKLPMAAKVGTTAASHPGIASGILGASGANLYGLGSATEDDPYGADDALINTGLGAGLGMFGAGVGNLISKGGSKVASKINKDEILEAIPEVATNKGGMLDLTRGQSTGAAEDLIAENRARQGLLGAERKAQVDALDLEQQQAVKGILGNMGASDDLFSGVDDMTSMLKGEYKAAKKGVDQAYNIAREAGKDTYIVQGELKNLFNSAEQVVKPFASRMKMGTAKDTAALYDDLLSLKGKRTVPLEDLYAYREVLTGAANDAQGADKTALYRLKGAFDKFMQDDLANALKNGEDDMVAKHYNAVKSNREMASRFLDNDAIKNIVTDPKLTTEQVGNVIFGSSYGKTNTGQLAQDIIKAAGENGQQAKDLLKQSFMSRILAKGTKGDTVKIGTLKTTIDDALKKNPTFVKEVLSESDVQTLKTLSDDLAKIERQYGKDVYNSSGSSYELARMLGKGVRWVPGVGPITADLLEKGGASLQQSGAKSRFDKSIADALNNARNQFNSGQSLGALLGGITGGQLAE